jgi:putative inorganic carbon (HCO3(-)) transporter
MAARLERSQFGRQAVVAMLAVALGLAAGVDPRVAVAAAIGLGFVVLVLADLTFGLCLFAVVAFLDQLPELGGSLLSFSKIVGFLIAISWLAKVSTSNDTRNDFLAAHPVFAYVLALFVAYAALSLTWAESASTGTTPLMRYALNLILFLIVFTAVRTPKSVVAIVGAYVAGAGFAAAYGLLVPPTDVAYYDVSRVVGTIGDPNELASVLVPGAVLGVVLAVVLKRAPLLRLLSLGAAVLCAAGVFLSLSRGGLVAFGASLLVALVVSGRWRAQTLVLTVLVVASAFTYYGFFASEDQRAHVTTVQEGGTGRADLWKVAWRMVQDKPVVGVGVGNFTTASVHYLLEPGAIRRDEFIVGEAKVAHNTYLQVLAELGVIGLTLFLAIIAFSLTCVLKAVRVFERLDERGLELLSRGLFVALAGILAADFFISEQFSKQLWLMLGLGPALLGVATGLARGRIEAEEDDADWRPDEDGEIELRRLAPA